MTPPLESSGGIGRVVSYLLEALPADQPRPRLLDSRGKTRNPVFSVLPMLRVALTLVILRLRGALDVVHVNMSGRGSLVRKIPLTVLAKALGLRVVLHLHSGHSPEQFFDNLAAPAKAAVRFGVRRADIFVVLGEFWRRYAIERLKVPAARIVVLPHGVPGPATSTVPPRVRAGQPLRILFLGRLEERKGAPELLAALGSPALAGLDWQATLAGDGDVERYARVAADTGIADRVSFPGWVRADEAGRLLDEAHVLVLPSHAEGLPLAVLEAMAHARPVIATPVGAVPDSVTHGREGLLVKPGDVAELAQAIALLGSDSEGRVRMGEQARATWERRHNPAVFARRVMEIWQDAYTGGNR